MRKKKQTSRQQRPLQLANLFLKYVILLNLNIAIVGVLNGLYVYLTLQELQVTTHLLIQICFAIIKYTWNFIIVPSVILSPLSASPRRSWLHAGVNMLNSVFIPCIASSFTSTSCFQVFIQIFFLIKNYIVWPLQSFYFLLIQRVNFYRIF